MPFIKFTDKFAIPTNVQDLQNLICSDTFKYSPVSGTTEKNIYSYQEKRILLIAFSSITLDFFITLFHPDDTLTNPCIPTYGSKYRQIISGRLDSFKDALIDIENRILVIPSTLLAWNY